MKPRVSLCMILRDSEKSIRRCLDSARGLYDELVVVMDDRSKDATEDIVRREYGARVVRRKWDGFAEMRNHSLRIAKHDWCLILDGDERVGDVGDYREAMSVIADGYECDAVFATILSVDEDDAVMESDRQFRIIRRAVCSYQFPVHNQLRGYDKGKLGTTSLTIRASYPRDLRSRAARAEPALLEMLNTATAGSEEELHALYFLARTYGMTNRNEEAIEYARRVVNLVPDHVGYCSAWTGLLRATIATRGRDEAWNVYTEAASHHPGLPDLHWWAMVMCAERWIEAAVTPGNYQHTPQVSRQWIGPMIETAGPMIGMQFASKPPSGEAAA